MIIYLVNDCCFVLIFKDSSYVHQSDNVALTFYLFSSSDAVERDRMHFTPKTYIARSIFALTCVTYKKLVPSMSWEVIEFFKSPYNPLF